MNAWIARDCTGEMKIFNHMPVKDKGGFWHDLIDKSMLWIVNSELPEDFSVFPKTTDKKPIEIEITIKKK